MRIGLVGCGYHGKGAVIPAIRQYSRAMELVAVADPNPQAMSEITGVAKYTDPREMFARERLDVAYVATLPETHAPLTIEAFNAGLHVVCEKPMADSVEACRAVLAAAEKTGRHLAITFESRYYGHHRTIRRWIDAGLLGEVQAVHLQEFWDGHKTFGPLSERRARLIERSGGLDCGVHKLDLARFFSRGDWKTIHAIGAWFGEPFTKPPHIGVLGQMDNGVLVTVNTSMAYAANIKPRPMNEVLVIAGTRGVISLTIDEPTPEKFSTTGARVNLHCEDRVESCPVNHPNHNEVIGLLLDDLAGVIQGHPAPPELAQGNDGLMAQIALEQANADSLLHQSGTTG